MRRATPGRPTAAGESALPCFRRRRRHAHISWRSRAHGLESIGERARARQCRGSGIRLVVGLGAARRRDDRPGDLPGAPLRLAALRRRRGDHGRCARRDDGERGRRRHQQRLGLRGECVRSGSCRHIRSCRNHSLARAPRDAGGRMEARRGRARRCARYADHRSRSVFAADLCRVGERHRGLAGLRARSRRWLRLTRVAGDDRRCGARAGQPQWAGAVSDINDDVAARGAQPQPRRRHAVRAVRQLPGPGRGLDGSRGRARRRSRWRSRARRPRPLPPMAGSGGPAGPRSTRTGTFLP